MCPKLESNSEPSGARPSDTRVPPGSGLHPAVALARDAVESYIRDGVHAEPSRLPPNLPERAGAFVTIRREGDLRGCIGTIEPVEPTLAEEIIHSAELAATDDPRFAPVIPSELPELTYSVSVLEPPEPIDGPDALDPATYGVIVQAEGRRGLLLPGIEGIETAEVQVDLARRKAGIRQGTPLNLYRFGTLHFDESTVH